MSIYPSNGKQAGDPFARTRQRMVDRLQQKGIGNARVLGAMTTIPRHLFVEEALADRAYDDHPLPIGFGQTISQPYMVALMTELLQVERHHRLLEIGSGSGYQTAILAYLARVVYAIERIPELVEMARERLRRMGIGRVVMKAFDGTPGWAEFAPYDGILVAAGAPEIPSPLVDQLAIGGRLVIPVGDERVQRLIRLTRGETANQVEDHGGCVFVKLVGEFGWPEDDENRHS